MGQLFPHLPENLLPPGLDHDAFIAGGYAACPERATDIDVWVTDKHDALHALRDTLLAHLRATKYTVQEETATEGFRVDGHGYDEMDVRILKVGTVTRKGALPIHLMVTDAPFIPILMRFDVSTHQVAIIPSRYAGVQTVQGPEWTPLTAEPVQLRETSATPARMEKIRARYADMRTNGKG